MTAPAAPAADPAAPARPTSTAPTPAQLWRRFRGALAAAALLLAAGLVLAVLNSGGEHGRLDPRSADAQGTRALAELLRDHGVQTRVVTGSAEALAATGPDTTLVVASPGLLTESQRAALRTAMDLSGGRTVLIGAGPTALDGLAPGVTAADAGRTAVLDPGCPLPAAVSAGPATTGRGFGYATGAPGATGCYPAGGLPTVLVLPATGHASGADTVLLGSPEPLFNHRLDEQGNASLALQLLGTRPHVTWYLPNLGDPDAADQPRQGFLDLIPAGWSWALLQLALAAALAAAWRVHRLGPLVTEQLPVAVRASEATEGRARLYGRARARDRAAAVLRAATRERLAALLGVPPSAAHDPAALLPVVSARLPARATELTALLFGPVPPDDRALVTLTDHLDALEREVRSS
ncbi:DUF4350 domain-containing protein [Streptomyces sp. NPDC089919]|uniref:DUF4350 domain-containing protein n=1 Tax=Streptomyces sp. NPDC089919 TaxID=3155188 RepID=UPI00343B805B